MVYIFKWIYAACTESKKKKRIETQMTGIQKRRRIQNAQVGVIIQFVAVVEFLFAGIKFSQLE